MEISVKISKLLMISWDAYRYSGRQQVACKKKKNEKKKNQHSHKTVKNINPWLFIIKNKIIQSILFETPLLNLKLRLFPQCTRGKYKQEETFDVKNTSLLVTIIYNFIPMIPIHVCLKITFRTQHHRRALRTCYCWLGARSACQKGTLSKYYGF